MAGLAQPPILVEASVDKPFAPVYEATATGGSASVSPVLVQECRETRSEISRLETAQVDSRRARATQEVQEAQNTVSRCTARLTTAKADLAKATQDLQQYSTGWVPGKLLTSKAKKEGKATEMQAKVDACMASVDAANLELTQATSQLDAARTSEQEASSQVSLLHSLRAKQQTQLDNLFSARQTANDAAQAALVNGAAALASEAGQNRGWSAQYADAEAGLRRALGNLQAATKMLKTAQFVGRVEMVQDIGHRAEFGRHGRMGMPPGMRREGLVGEAVQLGQVRRANDMVSKAGEEILRVHAALPSLPYIEPALVRSCAAGIFMDVLVGNMLSEMVIQSRIRANLAQVDTMVGQTQECAKWAAANAQAFQGRAAQAEAGAAAKTAELRALRLSLLQTM